MMSAAEESVFNLQFVPCARFFHVSSFSSAGKKIQKKSWCVFFGLRVENMIPTPRLKIEHKIICVLKSVVVCFLFLLFTHVRRTNGSFGIPSKIRS